MREAASVNELQLFPLSPQPLLPVSNRTERSDSLQRITIVTIADNSMEHSITRGNISAGFSMSRQGSIGQKIIAGPNDDWLPITESREGNKYYAAFHLICSGIGPQALMLPLAFTVLGWTWGIICLILAFIWQLYTIWILVRLHESVQGTRYSRYLQLSVASFGEKMGKILAIFPVMYLSGATCVMLIITGGQTMELFYETVAENGANKLLSMTEWFLLFTCVAVVIALGFPNLNSLAMVSLTGAMAAITYCSMIWIISVSKERPSGISHNPSTAAKSHMERISGVLNAVGIVVLVFRGHNLVLEIQGTLPSSSKKSSQKSMLKAVAAAYLVIASTFFPTAIAGYWAYGNRMPDTGGILKAFVQIHGHSTSKVILGTTYLLVIISCLSSFQIYAMPVFDNLEMSYTTKKNQKCPRYVRLVFRLIFGGLTFFISFTFPFLPSLAGLLGGFTLPLTYVYPCFMWIAMKRPPRYTANWCFNILLGGLGVVLSILLVAAALWNLIDNGLHANFFKPK